MKTEYYLARHINPDNRNQARLFFCMYSARDNKEDRHPQIVMNDLAIKHKFKILGAVPQTAFDGWDFWVEFDDIEEIHELPPLFRFLEWKPINQA